MKQKHSEYNFLKDPHLAYFLQSPYKVAQLLKSRRYKLNNNMLVQIDTNDSFQIDSYVLKRLNLQEISKSINFDQFNKTEQTNGENNNEKAIKYSNELKKSMPKLSQRIKEQSTKKKQNNKKESILPYIKGLKQFKMKIL